MSSVISEPILSHAIPNVDMTRNIKFIAGRNLQRVDEFRNFLEVEAVGSPLPIGRWMQGVTGITDLGYPASLGKLHNFRTHSVIDPSTHVSDDLSARSFTWIGSRTCSVRYV